MAEDSAQFHRPDHWPTGLLHEWGVRCPKCNRHEGVTVDATVTLELTPDGSIDVGGSHEYDPDSAARCGECGFAGPLGRFYDFISPSDLWTPQDSLADTECGLNLTFADAAACWQGLSGVDLVAAHEIAVFYWPGIRITATSDARDCLVVRESTPEKTGLDAAQKAALEAQLYADLVVRLGEPADRFAAEERRYVRFADEWEEPQSDDGNPRWFTAVYRGARWVVDGVPRWDYATDELVIGDPTDSLLASPMPASKDMSARHP